MGNFEHLVNVLEHARSTKMAGILNLKNIKLVAKPNKIEFIDWLRVKLFLGLFIHFSCYKNTANIFYDS